MSALPKQKGQEWSPGPEAIRDDRPLFSTPSAAELQERLIETLTVVADWKDDLGKQRSRMLLREELIGVEQEELDELKAEFDELARCMKALAWRPDGVKP
jgi:hypothetical protein